MATGQQIADYYVRIGADKSGLSAGLSGAKQELTNFGGGIATTMGGAGAAAGGSFVRGFVGMLAPLMTGTAIIGLAKQVASVGIAYNAMKESAGIAFTTMLGSGEKAVAMMRELEAVAAKTPFAFQDLTSATQRLMAMGFAAKDVIPTLTAVGDAAAAMGGSPETIDRITRALGQMQSKGAIASQEMLQLAEAGIPAWRYLADMLGVTIPEAMKAVEARQVDAATGIKAIIAGINSDYAGMMEKQSHTFSGLMSTMKDELRMIAGDVTVAMFDSLKGGLEEFVNYLPTVRTSIKRVILSDAEQGQDRDVLEAQLADLERAQAALQRNAALNPMTGEAVTTPGWIDKLFPNDADAQAAYLKSAIDTVRMKLQLLDQAAQGASSSVGWLFSSAGMLEGKTFASVPFETPDYAMNDRIIQGYQDRGIEQAALKAGEEGAKQYVSGFKSAASELRSTLEGIMSPTSVTEEDMLSAKLGSYTEKWDEYRRRMQDVVNQGGASPWAANYGMTGSEDEIRLEAMRRMSAFDRYDFSKVPEGERGAMKEAIKEQYRQQIETQRNKKAILDELVGEMGISGSEYASLTGDSAMMGQQFAEGVTTAMGESGIAQPLATAWRDDIEKNKDVLIDAGKSAGGKLVAGILTAIKEGAFIKTMALAVAPEVADILARKTGQGGATP